MLTAKTCGESLHSLAKEQGEAKEILSELRYIAVLFREHPDYVKILDSPQIARDELMEILNEDFFGKVSRYTLNFLKLLCEKHMVHCIDECFKEYEKQYNKDNNIRIVSVTTAKPVSEELLEKLAIKLEKKTGGKIVLKRKIDESCIGGIIIETDGMKIDSSVKAELDNIKQSLIK
ncbi:MAG: ATP synthase F1 subunit delta [Hominilimicola sp.]